MIFWIDLCLSAHLYIHLCDICQCKLFFNLRSQLLRYCDEIRYNDLFWPKDERKKFKPRFRFQVFLLNGWMRKWKLTVSYVISCLNTNAKAEFFIRNLIPSVLGFSILWILFLRRSVSFHAHLFYRTTTDFRNNINIIDKIY